LRILEFTGGAPVSWAVLIPPAVKPDSNRIGAVLFFRPGDASYTNTDDLSIGSLTGSKTGGPSGLIRYLMDPPEATPFFPQASGWQPYPPCGWERQVSQAGKCALFVHPFPSGSSYGNLISAKFPDMLASVVKALWSDDTIGGSVCSDLRLARIAVSGFSAGGTATYGCLTAMPDKIDELYLFDPVNTGSYSNAIGAWFRRGGKKLRMFGGGYQHSTMVAIAQQLASSDASVSPAAVNGWDGMMSLYPVAVQMAKNPTFNNVSDARLPDTSLGSLSLLTHMFVDGKDGNGGLKMQGKLPSGGLVPGVIKSCIAQEAASAIFCMVSKQRIGQLCSPDTPSAKLPYRITSGDDDFTIASKADFDNNLTSITALAATIRHQWPVVGGKDLAGDTNRGKNFVGFLGSAIASSGFP
jgi:hypothetical protein